VPTSLLWVFAGFRITSAVPREGKSSTISLQHSPLTHTLSQSALTSLTRSQHVFVRSNTSHISTIPSISDSQLLPWTALQLNHNIISAGPILLKSGLLGYYWTETQRLVYLHETLQKPWIELPLNWKQEWLIESEKVKDHPSCLSHGSLVYFVTIDYINRSRFSTCHL
jgi:hypothetical protein